MDVKKRLREAHWAWWLPAAILVGICLLPSGHIEASPGEVLRPPVWMAPMAWPLLAMAVLFGAAAFTEWPRKRAWRIVFFGAGASLLFEIVLSAFPGNVAIYSFGLGTDLGNRIFVDFELDVLAFGILPMDLLLVALSFLVLWSRHGRELPAASAALGPAEPPTASSPAPGPAPAARQSTPEAPAPGRPVPAPPPEMPVSEPVPPPESPPAEPPAVEPAPPPELTAGAPAPQPAPPQEPPATPPQPQTAPGQPAPAAPSQPAGATQPAPLPQNPKPPLNS